MRFPNDVQLAEEVPEIDIILGGHDHDYEYENVDFTGHDFKKIKLKVAEQFFLNLS